MSLEAAAATQDSAVEEVVLAPAGAVDRDAEATTFEDRVTIMLRVFVEELSETQQRVYLMRHPFPKESGSRDTLLSFDDQLAAFLDECDAQQGKTAKWTSIAARLDTTEKTAKKEYLRALHGLLAGACDSIFQGKSPSGLVRRMLTLLNKIVHERDLRIRDNAGLGLGKIVARWEVALRFVLNNDRVSANPDEDDPFAAESSF